MHKILVPALFLALVAGCGGGKTPKRPEPKPTGEPVACTLELAMVCAEGAADGCLDGKTTFHACVSTTEAAGPACELEIAKVCGDGQVDACLATPAMSDHHVCVFTAAAPPVATSCPAGQTMYFPGCGEPTLSAEGCYAACGANDACGAGTACKTVTTDPCHATSGAEATCDACGAETKLCMPAS